MSNRIHESAILSGEIDLGSGNEIGPYVVLYGPLKIGNNNLIGPNTVIGTPGQDTRNPRYDSSQSQIEIGDDNIIREGVAIHKPCYKNITKIGNRTYLMSHSTINHDALIEDNVTITSMASLGGIVTILEKANIALGVSIQQYCVIGQYALVGMGAAVTKNIRPFTKYIPGKGLFVNDYAVEKYGFSEIYSQIEDYVLRNKFPTDSDFCKIILHFDASITDSPRETYMADV